MRKIIATSVMLLAVISLAAVASAAGPSRVDLKIVENGQAVENAEVVIFMSCDKVAGRTDENGDVALESECGGRQFWVEINGKRVSTIYNDIPGTEVIDIARVTFIEWMGGR